MNNLRHPLSQESRQRALRSPKQIGERVRVTAAPIYLLATAVLLMIGAFILWGFLGVVTDKAYYSGFWKLSYSDSSGQASAVQRMVRRMRMGAPWWATL